MRRIRTAVRRTVAGAAATGALGVAVLGTEAALAARRTYLPAESAPAVEGSYGVAGAPVLRVAVLGDSTAAGVGVDRSDDTAAGQLAARLAAGGRRVQLRGYGVSGARASDLRAQVDRALGVPDPPQLAVLLVGANDATHLSRLPALRRDLRDAVRRLRGAGAAVVVGTCPDLGSVTAFAQPLRLVAAWQGRRVGRAERAAVADAGGTSVDLAARTGPEFRRDPRRYLSTDRFHPSAEGYRLWAEALADGVRQALGPPGAG